jgi:hypothetical protein
MNMLANNDILIVGWFAFICAEGDRRFEGEKTRDLTPIRIILLLNPTGIIDQLNGESVHFLQHGWLSLSLQSSPLLLDNCNNCSLGIGQVTEPLLFPPFLAKSSVLEVEETKDLTLMIKEE